MKSIEFEPVLTGDHTEVKMPYYSEDALPSRSSDALNGRLHTLSPAAGLLPVYCSNELQQCNMPPFHVMFTPNRSFQVSSPTLCAHIPYNLSTQEYSQQLQASATLTNANAYERELQNLPKDLYIEKLMSLMDHSETDLLAYRDTLHRMAKTKPECPNGKLITRRGSRKNTATYKIANDCYILKIFLEGDKSKIETIFSRSSTQITQENKDKEDNQENLVASKTLNIEMAKILENVMDLTSKYNDLIIAKRENSQLIEQLETRVASLEQENVRLQEKLNSHTQKSSEELNNHGQKLYMLNERLERSTDISTENHISSV